MQAAANAGEAHIFLDIYAFDKKKLMWSFYKSDLHRNNHPLDITKQEKL